MGFSSSLEHISVKICRGSSLSWNETLSFIDWCIVTSTETLWVNTSAHMKRKCSAFFMVKETFTTYWLKPGTKEKKNVCSVWGQKNSIGHYNLLKIGSFEERWLHYQKYCEFCKNEWLCIDILQMTWLHYCMESVNLFPLPGGKVAPDANLPKFIQFKINYIIV